MNLIQQLQKNFTDHIKKLFALEQSILNNVSFTINVDENKKDFGDINCNAAMVIAQSLKRNPREIAQAIIADFKHEHVEKIEIAGPGFLNLFLTVAALHELMRQLATGEQFFKLDSAAPKHKYSVEFVSANPTGPLHLGHGRGGIIGDVLASVLKFIGHTVTKEFYINDAGNQIQKLGQSFKARCQQALGIDAQIPEEGYQGEYLVTMANDLIKESGKEILEKPDAFFADYAKEKLLALIKQTLANYGIHYDVWFSEKTLHTSGAIALSIELLQKKGFIYEKEGALWFKSTDFGDDKDRVVRKSTGELTYVAADIAYMQNKIARGADKLILVLGHDHHGYVLRLEGLLKALDLGPYTLEAVLYQLVKMKASGQLVRMSKRAGNIVTLEDVIEEVGTDVARFFYLNRKADAQLEFDLDLALKHSEENPVYYVQYAYVRTGSILAKAALEEQFTDIGTVDVAHIGQAEAFLIKKIIALKNLLETIGTNHQTHLLTYYVLELANAFHSYYGKNRVLEPENIPQSRARLLLIMRLRETFKTCLTLLGISCPEKM